MSKEQPAALRLADELLEPVPDYPEPTSLEMAAATELRNLHTENTALRVTEDNLRQELQECQDQRRAAFRRIEELDAMRAQIGQGVLIGWLYDWTHSSALGKPDEHFTSFTNDEVYARKHSNVRPVFYKQPQAPQQNPLTDEQIEAIFAAIPVDKYDGVLSVARAIEAAHNIGEKK